MSSNINLLQHPKVVGLRTRIAALDPGETTGYALFTGNLLSQCGQIKEGDVPKNLQTIQQVLLNFKPDVVVAEDYRVYSWKAKDHAWNELSTAKLIGAIEVMCQLNGWRLKMQMAQQAKGFCTDDKLHDWGLWIKGQKHARDAIRHGIYYLLFEQAKVHKSGE